MTTIIWDGKYLAADSLMTYGNAVLASDFKKIFSMPSLFTYLAICGDPDWPYTRAEWIMKNGLKLKAGAGSRDEINVPKGCEFSMLLIKNGKGCISDSSFNFLPVSPPFAMGSGTDYALGNYEATADVRQAVAAAIESYVAENLRRKK